MSNDRIINTSDAEEIRKLVNDKIINDLASKDQKTKEAAANAAWQLAQIDRKNNQGTLSTEQMRTLSLAYSVISKIDLNNQSNPYTQKETLGPTLAELQKRLNDSTTGKSPLPPVETLYIRTEISRLSPNKQNLSSDLTVGEKAWMAQTTEQRHRDLNKFLIFAAGPVASPLAEIAALKNAPAQTVNDLLEVGIGLTAASGLASRAKLTIGRETPLEPVSRGLSAVTTKATQSAHPKNNPLKLQSENGSCTEYDYMYEPGKTVPAIKNPSIKYNANSPTGKTDYHIKENYPNGSYQKGEFERILRELQRYEERVQELDAQISGLSDAVDISAKQGIRGRVIGYFHNGLPQLEAAKAQMKHANEAMYAPKTTAELKAYEARENLLTALNTPVLINGDLIPRSHVKASSQTIARLRTEYEQAMENLWPQDIPAKARAEAPVLFKSNKLNNVYHVTNPTGEKINCVSCAEALAESIKGYPASANRYNDSLYHQANNNIFIKAFNIPQQNIHSNLASVERQMLEWGDGAIAIIAGKRDNFKGHNFVVVNDAGTVRFLDRQADNDLLSPKGINFSEIAIFRVDKPQQQAVSSQPRFEQSVQHSASLER